MSEMQPVTIVGQVASHLRDGIQRGRWQDEMPGRDVLARDLGVSPMTVLRALKMLEREKLLAPQGTGRRRRILLSINRAPTSLRVVILPYEPGDYKLDFSIDLQHQLHAQGHSVSFASKSLQNLKMDVNRVARLVQKTEADAWIIIPQAFNAASTHSSALLHPRRLLSNRPCSSSPHNSISPGAAFWHRNMSH